MTLVLRQPWLPVHGLVIIPLTALAGFPFEMAAACSAISIAYQALQHTSRSWSVGRWDADGSPDSLIRKGGTLTVLHGNGPGWMQHPARLAVDVSGYDWVLGVSDLRSAQGHPDLLVRQKGTGRVYALPGSASGIGARVYLGTVPAGYDLAD